MSATASDASIRAAVEHWAPRLIANGIDYNDFQATVARVARWEDWSAEWSRTAERHEALAREAEARGSAISAGEAYVRAALCHHFGKFVYFADLDRYRAAHAATVANYRRAAPTLDPPAEPVAIPYAGRTMPAYLRRPPGVERPPIVLIVVGLDSVKEEMNTLEAVFHRRGLATLTFDGPGQGESEAALPIEPAFEQPLGAVIDVARGLPNVDGTRIGAIGVSLGGYYLGRAAAFESRLACAVAVGGPYDFAEIFDTVPGLTRQAVQFRSHAPDLEAARRFASALTLRDVARRIELPFMIVFGKQDRLIPYQQAERWFAEMPSPAKRLELYEDGNHVCNNIPYVWRPLAADWIAGHLRGS